MASRVEMGQVIDGRYRIESFLGSGGMGTVYVAKHQVTHQLVALKVLEPRKGSQAYEIDRFTGEIQATASLQHPGIISVYDAGRDEATDAFYYAMELLTGQTMAAWMATRPPWRSAMAVFRQMLGALGAAHEAGIVHRDIKPDNIFLVRQTGGTVGVKVLDFGLSRGHRETSMTQSGVMMGTPLYMSPEQALDPKTVTTASDVWSCGVILYQMLAGDVPFTAETPQGLFMQTVQGDHPDIREVVADMPAGMADLVDRCLSKDAADRPATANDLLGELNRIVTHDSIITMPTLDPALAPSVYLSSVAAPPPHRWLPLALGAVALVAATLAVVGWARPTPEPQPRASIEAVPAAAAITPAEVPAPIDRAAPPAATAVAPATEPIAAPTLIERPAPADKANVTLTPTPTEAAAPVALPDAATAEPRKKPARRRRAPAAPKPAETRSKAVAEPVSTSPAAVADDTPTAPTTEPIEAETSQTKPDTNPPLEVPDVPPKPVVEETKPKPAAKPKPRAAPTPAVLPPTKKPKKAPSGFVTF